MLNFLHNFQPNNVLISFGSVNVYWYGLFIVFGMLFGMVVILKLAGKYGISKDMLIDLIFWMIIGGVVGARIYDVLLNLSYYSNDPIQSLKIWQGGLAIHGAIIGGLVALYIFVSKYKLDFWLISSLIVPGAILGQAIGRWGNFFNQELFGKPTDLPWGIFISPPNRPIDYFNQPYYHPVFLYESMGSLMIFGILMLMHLLRPKFRITDKFITASYLALYSLLRFFTEYLRVDQTPIYFGLRLPQIVSIIFILLALYIVFSDKKKRKLENNPALAK